MAGTEVEFGDHVDFATFEQILEMDDEEDDTREFSRSIVFGFFEQAEETLGKMNKAIGEGDLDELSALGHFLKGSSATLGFNKIRDQCEKIQHWGHKKDETGTVDEEDGTKCLNLIKEATRLTGEEVEVVNKLMNQYYG